MLSSIFLFVSFCIVILCSDFFSLLRVCARERAREWECKTAYEMANGHLPHIVSASGSHCHLRSCYYHICHKLFSLAFTLRVRPKLHHFFRLFLIFFFPPPQSSGTLYHGTRSTRTRSRSIHVGLVSWRRFVSFLSLVRVWLPRTRISSCKGYQVWKTTHNSLIIEVSEVSTVLTITLYRLDEISRHVSVK